MMQPRTNSPKRLTLLFSLLMGCAAATFFYLLPNILPFQAADEQPNSEAIPLRHTDRAAPDLSGLFGLRLVQENMRLQCNSTQWRLTGVIFQPNDALFTIEGKTGTRVYRPDVLVDGKYPIITWDASRLVIREAGHYTLLCLKGDKNSGLSTTVDLKKKNQKSINTPYFSLNPVSIPELSVIGYRISRCDYRCKMALTAVGLQSNDMLLAIDGVSLSEDTWDSLQQSLKQNTPMVVTVKRQGHSGKVDITIAPESHLRQLLLSKVSGNAREQE